jgi:hypothetical protein
MRLLLGEEPMHLVDEELGFRVHGAVTPSEASKVRVWGRRWRRQWRTLQHGGSRSGVLACLGITELESDQSNRARRPEAVASTQRIEDWGRNWRLNQRIGKVGNGSKHLIPNVRNRHQRRKEDRIA